MRLYEIFLLRENHFIKLNLFERFHFQGKRYSKNLSLNVLFQRQNIAAKNLFFNVPNQGSTITIMQHYIFDTFLLFKLVQVYKITAELGQRRRRRRFEPLLS